MNKDREAFEAWWVTFDIKPDLSELDKDSEGYYIDLTTQRMWQAWKAARAQDEWISVEDRLPEIDTMVMTKFATGEQIIDWRYREERKDYGKRALFYKETFYSKRGLATHWKPIEPPKEQNDD